MYKLVRLLICLVVDVSALLPMSLCLCDLIITSSSFFNLYALLSVNPFSGKKSLYVRLGARGDWPDIMPPGWNPASGKEEATSKAYY